MRVARSTPRSKRCPATDHRRLCSAASKTSRQTRRPRTGTRRGISKSNRRSGFVVVQRPGAVYWPKNQYSHWRKLDAKTCAGSIPLHYREPASRNNKKQGRVERDEPRHRILSELARLSALTSFRTRNYRFQWPADLLTSWAFEMETLILGWYVLSETGSVVLLTVFASLNYTGTLIAPMLGVAGDRIGHRDLLAMMRAA